MMVLLFFIQLSFAESAFFSDLENFQTKSLNLQSERQNQEAKKQILNSKSLFWTPTVEVSLNERRGELNGTRNLDTQSLQANITLNLFRGGADWNEYQGAKSGLRAQELQVLKESLRTEVEAANLIFKSLYLSEALKIQEAQSRLKEEAFSISMERYRQGKLPLQEATKAEVDSLQQINRLRLAKLEVLENISAIQTAFVNEVRTKNWPFSESTNLKIESSKTAPLVEQKYWLSQSLYESYKSAGKGHWPTLDLSFQYSEFPLNTTSRDKEWTGWLRLTLPIWSRYEVSAQKASEYARYITGLNEYKFTQNEVLNKNKFLKDKIALSKENLKDAKKNLERSKKLYRDILRSYRFGRISTNDILIEQSRLFESESTLALSQLYFHQALIESCVLSGLKSFECLNTQ